MCCNNVIFVGVGLLKQNKVIKRMKKTLSIILSLLCAALSAKMPELWFNPPPRKIVIDQQKSMTLADNGRIYFGITVPEDAGKPAAFAAKEMADLLGKVLKTKIPVSNTRNPDWKYAIILGDSALSRKAGIDVSKVSRDGFIMRTVGSNIYIAGVDEKEKDSQKLLRGESWKVKSKDYQRGTIFGMYDFLERFAGIRFYLPNELGTIIPETKKLTVPAMDIFDRPDCIIRFSNTTSIYQKKDWMDANADPVITGSMMELRLRTHTRYIPNGHGLGHLGYFKRFGKTHPEYFAMDERGKRWTGYPGFLCFSSKELKDEVVQDALSALRGEPPQKRGVCLVLENGLTFHHWYPAVYHKDGFFGVHLQDGYKSCHCEKCKNQFQNPEQIWEMTADVANAVKKAGIPGYITQMGYHFYQDVPKVPLPDNVLVQVATTGAWGCQTKAKRAKENSLLQRWNKKLNKKVWLWNYYLAGDNEESPYSTPGLSQTTPIAIAEYYKQIAPWISGAFLNAKSEARDLLNIYVSMKVLWDLSLDPHALMDEFYQKMFGNAAPFIKQYMKEAEDIWLHKIRGATVETPLGPQPVKLSKREIWEKVYTPRLLKKWDTLFRKAENAVRNSPQELKRVKFFRKFYLEPAQEQQKKYTEACNAVEVLSLQAKKISESLQLDGKMTENVWQQANPHQLNKFKFGKIEICAYFKCLYDKDNLYFGFESIDPKHAELEIGKGFEARRFWGSATIEILLNPNNDRTTLYHFALNPGGVFRALRHPGDLKWNTTLKHAVHIGKDRWSAEIVIPLKDLPGLTKGFPFNISYNRQLKTAKPCSDLYTWTPYLRNGFEEPDRFGKLYFDAVKPNNMIAEYDFAHLTRKNDRIGTRWNIREQGKTAKVSLDSGNFVSGGQALLCSGEAAEDAAGVTFGNIPLERGKKYRYSYFVKAEIPPGGMADGYVCAGKQFFFPENKISGTLPWTRIQGEFTVPAKQTRGIIGFILKGPGKHYRQAEFRSGIIGFTLKGPGKLWIDHIVLQKIN